MVWAPLDSTGSFAFTAKPLSMNSRYHFKRACQRFTRGVYPRQHVYRAAAQWHCLLTSPPGPQRRTHAACAAALLADGDAVDAAAGRQHCSIPTP